MFWESIKAGSAITVGMLLGLCTFVSVVTLWLASWSVAAGVALATVLGAGNGVLTANNLVRLVLGEPDMGEELDGV